MWPHSAAAGAYQLEAAKEGMAVYNILPRFGRDRATLRQRWEFCAELITNVKVPGPLWRGPQQYPTWFSMEYVILMQPRHVPRKVASE
jgi:hypothetical protein